jgi:hypothetical protein
MRRRMKTALATGQHAQRGATCEDGGVPGQAVQDPDQPEGPADGRVAAEAPPAEQQVCTDLLAEDEGGEDDEHGGAGIEGELQEDDLGGDAWGGEVCERAGARRAATAWHEPRRRTLSCGGHVWRVVRGCCSVSLGMPTGLSDCAQGGGRAWRNGSGNGALLAAAASGARSRALFYIATDRLQYTVQCD